MEVNLEKIPFGIDFHPSSQLVSAALITGDIHLYRYAAALDSSPQRLLQLHAHQESCRAVRFINNGQAIVSASADCSILATDVETGTQITRLDNAHDDAIYTLINVTESTIASGDDAGCIKPHEDYVSDITFAADAMKLIGTSGDGTLSVCSLRRNKVQTCSEFSEEELTSVVLVKNGQKVVCGSQSGTLLLYSWGYFKDCSDRFVDLSPNSVDAMLKLDEDRIITGSENGIISLVGILPNKIIQPIAEHSEYPVERLALSHDKKILGSISHDQTLKLWDLDELLQDTGDVQKTVGSDSDDDEMDVDANPSSSNKGSKSKNTSKRNPMGGSSTFFADL
ncbi:hypothetical protein ACFE04_015851 [Oxalis oulophora]